MKRRVMIAFGSALLAASLGMSGCGGGGIEEGVPKDTTQTVDMNSIQNKMTPGKKQEPPPKVELPPTTGTDEKK